MAHSRSGEDWIAIFFIILAFVVSVSVIIWAIGC